MREDDTIREPGYPPISRKGLKRAVRRLEGDPEFRARMLEEERHAMSLAGEVAFLAVDKRALLRVLRRAEQRIEQLCSTVNTLAGFRKVRVADFAEEVRAAIEKFSREI